jgi:hypothetical protein
LLLYLRNNAQHINTLDFLTVEGLRDLPLCPQVQVMRLHDLSVQLGRGSRLPRLSSSNSTSAGRKPGLLQLLRQLIYRDADSTAADGASSPGVLQAVPQLTYLEVTFGAVYDRTDSGSVAAALAQLSGLRHLEVNSTGLVLPSCSLLSGVTNLTHLYLGQQMGPCGPDELGGPGKLLQDISCMRHLQQLHLFMEIVLTRDVLSALQQLMLLSLSSHHTESYASSVVRLEADALSGALQLQHLHLFQVVPLGPPGLELATLLSQIGQLQHLTHLEFWHYCDMEQQQQQREPIAASAFAALTASSKLVHLGIGCECVPHRGWEYIFRTGMQLQVLKLEGLDSSHLSRADLRRMVSSCPNLQQLSLRDALAKSHAHAAAGQLAEAH